MLNFKNKLKLHLKNHVFQWWLCQKRTVNYYQLFLFPWVKMEWNFMNFSKWKNSMEIPCFPVGTLENNQNIKFSKFFVEQLTVFPFVCDFRFDVFLTGQYTMLCPFSSPDGTTDTMITRSWSPTMLQVRATLKAVNMLSPAKHQHKQNLKKNNRTKFQLDQFLNMCNCEGRNSGQICKGAAPQNIGFITLFCIGDKCLIYILLIYKFEKTQTWSMPTSQQRYFIITRAFCWIIGYNKFVRQHTSDHDCSYFRPLQLQNNGFRFVLETILQD